MRELTAGAQRVPAAALTFLLAVGTVGGARGETLEDAWRLATARNQALAAAQLDVQGAEATERAARGARWPGLDANAGYTRLNASPELDVATPGGAFRSGPLFRDDQFVMGSIQMKLPLYAGGSISAGIDAARRGVAGALDSAEAAGADLRLEVAQAYVDVLRARHARESADSSVTSLAAHVRDVANMVDRQLVSRSDLLAARVTLANAEQERVRADNSVALALAAYNRYLGEPLDRSPPLTEALPADTALPGMMLGALVQRAFETRSELKGLSAEADQLAARARAERGKSLPQLALSGGYTHFDNQILDRQNFASVGVGFSWNLFDGGQARQRADALVSERRAAEHRLADLRSRIELEVRHAWLDIREAQARVAASREAVAQADENLRMARELYGAEMGTNTQVLDAVALRMSAAENRDNAVLDEALARIELAHAVGVL